MLPQHQRIRTAAQFFDTQRSGSRFGNRNVVVSANIRPTEDEPRAGFIVSKAVGNAVTRNKTKRRLRAIIAELFESGLGMEVVEGSVIWSSEHYRLQAAPVLLSFKKQRPMRFTGH